MLDRFPRGCLLIVVAIALAAGSQSTLAHQDSGGPQAGGAMDQGGRGRGGQGSGRGAFQRPGRDQNRPAEATGTAMIAGRVLAADTGRPVKRALVSVSGDGRPRSTSTDEQGRYSIAGLPAGTYNVIASKTGFVVASYGQRRALRTGTPVQLADGQQVTGADIRLPRGAVITGHVFDEDGEPLARSAVTVLRYQYAGGEKRLAAAGTDQSDDRGQYRVFGLPPGEYFVSAAAGGFERAVSRFMGPEAAPGEGVENTGYAPTYYPGVPSASDAMRLKLAAAQELTGIDFQLQLVPLASVYGTVTDGANISVMLVPDETTLGVRIGQTFRTRATPDGTFAIRGVPPGRYTVVSSNGTLAAVQSISVSGHDVSIALTPVAGADMTGTITLEAAGTEIPGDLSAFRVVPQRLGSEIAMGRNARPAAVSPNGSFTIKGLLPGRYIVRGAGPNGWMMKSVYQNGHDISDQPVEIRSDTISNLNVIFTDRIASVTGTVRDGRGTGVPETTVILFPTDPKLWLPHSRLILTGRTDHAGAYRISPVPAGDYLIVATDDVEQGEWFDPEFLEQISGSATKLTVGETEQRTQDLKAS
jgi:protocatechuate 3,4-dioxygenase beta subunit